MALPSVRIAPPFGTQRHCTVAAWYYNGCGAGAAGDNGFWRGAQNNNEQRAARAYASHEGKVGKTAWLYFPAVRDDSIVAKLGAAQPKVVTRNTAENCRICLAHTFYGLEISLAILYKEYQRGDDVRRAEVSWLKRCKGEIRCVFHLQLLRWLCC
jgi:hypothetical protein